MQVVSRAPQPEPRRGAVEQRAPIAEAAAKVGVELPDVRVVGGILGLGDERRAEPGAPAPGLERSNGGLATFAGGIPLFDPSPAMIGAVGVSGGTVSQDLEIAQAAAAALQELLSRTHLSSKQR